MENIEKIKSKISIYRYNGEFVSEIEYSNNKKYKFDLLNVLGDFILYFEKYLPPKKLIYTYVLVDNYRNHPFLSELEFPIKERDECTNEQFLLVELLQKIFSEKRIDLRQLDIIKQFDWFEVTNKYRVMHLVENRHYKSKRYKQNDLQEGYSIDEKYVFEPFTNIHMINNKLLEDEMLDYVKFEYSCNNLTDMIFSVLHYLSFSEFSFKKCEHCDKYFALNNFKNKYCSRKSPYPNYKNKSCKEAVNLLRTKFGKRFNQVQQNYRRQDDVKEEYNSADKEKKDTKSEKYRNEYEELYYLKNNNRISSVNDFKKLEKFLYPKKVVE